MRSLEWRRYCGTVVVCQTDGRRTIWHLRSEPLAADSGKATHRMAIFRDVTEQVDREEVLRRNERLACVGLLAAGIAHEINNPVGSALLAAETALAIKDSPDAGEQLTACLQNIITSMDRCGRIVRTLMRYSRDEPSEKQACNINDVAEQALELARPYAECHRAELLLELDPERSLGPDESAGDRVGVGQSASQRRRGRRRQRGGFDAIPRGRQSGVRVVVSDNGCGMNEEQLAHVFDPLYTTRRQAGGSGLGMSIAYGIIQGHEGAWRYKVNRAREQP